jgi:hypothetical protein
VLMKNGPKGAIDAVAISAAALRSDHTRAGHQ